MDGDTGRFIDDQQAVIFKNHALADLVGPVTGHRRRLGWGWPPQRRDSHQVTRRQAVIRLDPALVHPDFTLAQRPVQARFGHALELAHQVIVQPLAHRVLIHAQVMHSCGLLLLLRVRHKLPKSFSFLPFTGIVRACDYTRRGQ